MREADGYQPHLVSPEYGLQRLVDETLALTLEPVSTCVRRVHQVLLDAARRVPPAVQSACYAVLLIAASSLPCCRQPPKASTVILAFSYPSWLVRAM